MITAVTKLRSLFACSQRVSRRRKQDSRLRIGAEQCEQRLLLAATLEGRMWNDLNGSGERDSGEPFMNGWEVQLQSADGSVVATATTASIDLDNNNEIDPETEFGWYQFSDVAAGDYVVQQVQQTGWEQTSPTVSATRHLIELDNIHDLVIDPAGEIIYATTQGASVHRFDAETGQALDSIVLSGQLMGMDISPDGQFLLVANRTNDGPEATVYRVDLDTLAVTNITYDNNADDFGPLDVAIAANNTAIVMPSDYSSLLRQIDLVTNTVIVRNDIPNYRFQQVNYGTVQHGHDRSKLIVRDDDWDTAFIYDADTDTFGGNVDLDYSEAAVDRSGGRIALAMLNGRVNGTRVVDSSLNTVLQANNPIPAYGGGVLFDPLLDRLYVGDSATDAVFVYHSETLKEITRLSVGGKIAGGEMVITDDGRTMVVETRTGMAVLSLATVNRVSVSDAEVVSNQNFSNRDSSISATVSGRIWDDINKNGQRDSSESYVDGIEVRLLNDAGDVIGTQDSTSVDLNLNGVIDPETESGWYKFENLTAGQYRIEQQAGPNTEQTHPRSPDVAIFPIENRVNHVYDSSRDLIYISTQTGDVLRFHVNSQSFLEPLRIGQFASGLDITADGKFLYVGEGHASETEGKLYKVDLETQDVTEITYPLTSLEYGVSQVAIAANDKLFFSTSFRGSGWNPLHELDLTTGELTSRRRVRQSTRISRSEDRSALLFAEPNISSGPIFSYIAATDAFSDTLNMRSSASRGNFEVSADGTLFAAESYNFPLRIMNADLETVHQFERHGGGLQFDSVKELLYATDEVANEIIAYSTTTFEEQFRMPVGETVGRNPYATTITADGQALLMSTDTGLRLFQLPSDDHRAMPQFFTVEDGDYVDNADFGILRQGFNVTQTAGNQLNEGAAPGAEAVLSVSINREITEPVVLHVDVANDELTVGGVTALTFTAANWQTPQTLSIKAFNDVLADGDIDSAITLRVDEASDSTFVDVGNQSFQFTAIDDDVADFFVDNTQLATSEDGDVATINVMLTAQPVSDVIITVVAPDTDEFNLSGLPLTFTPENWSQTQPITAIGVDDQAVDGESVLPIQIFADAESPESPFHGSVNLLPVVVADNDLPGISVATEIVSVTEGDQAAQFEVRLISQPVGDVVLQVASGNTEEVSADVGTLTFTSDNWDIAQVVTVNAVDDVTVDGERQIDVTVSLLPDQSTAVYAALPQTVTVKTIDNDIAGFRISEAGDATSAMEGGDDDSFDVVLTAAPLSDVVLSVTPNDSSEVVASVDSLTFTPFNWSVPQTVDVTAVEDLLIDGDQVSDIVISVNADGSHDSFDLVPGQAISVTTYDNGLTPTVDLHAVGNFDPTQTPGFSWDALSGATGYQVWLDYAGTPRETGPIVNRTVETASLSLESPLAVGRYRVWIRANFEDGNKSPWTSEVFTVNGVVSIHQLPFYGTEGRPTIQWNEIPTAVGYRVYISNQTTAEQRVVDVTTTATEFTPGLDLSFGRYRIWVRQLGVNGYQGTWSSAAEYYVGPQLTGPTGSVGDLQPEFSWTAVTGAAKYRVYIAGPGGVVINEPSITGTTYTPPEALPVGDFRWWILPSTADGRHGVWSRMGKFSTGGRTSVEFSDDRIVSQLPELTWAEVSGAESYDIYIGRGRDSNEYLRVPNWTGNSFSFPLPVDDYQVWIRSNLADGQKIWGRGERFTVELPPSNLQVSDLTSHFGGVLTTTPTLEWEPVAGAASYEIVLHDEFNMIHLKDITESSWTPTTPLTKGEWVWFVRPVDELGNTGFFNVEPGLLETSGRTRLFAGTAESHSRITFIGIPVAGAERYELQLNNVTTGERRVVYETNLVEPVFVTQQMAPGLYRAWIRAVGADNLFGSWSVAIDIVVSEKG